jgi:hypothetical protein
MTSTQTAVRPAAARTGVPDSPTTEVHSPRSAGERGALVELLDDPERWPGGAAALLADLGFRLVSDARSGADSHLLVAIRDRPTLAHFDPEDVAYFAMTGSRGALVRLDRRAIDEPGETFQARALWGHVHVIDRVPVENRFLTFGGTLRGAVIDEELAVLDLRSPAPIVRWGGHSQGVDPLTDAIGAFFGRLIVPIDFEPGAEARIDRLSPGALYCAFLRDWLSRLERAERRGFDSASIRPWVVTAWNRARQDVAACEAGEALLAELRLG